MASRTARRRIHGSLIAALLLVCACASAQDESSTDANVCHSQNCELTRTLADLDLANPISDLDKNLGAGDRRFIGINGYACFAPGADKAGEPWSKEFGMRCLRGTSDLVEGDEHSALIAKAVSYARVYNSELLRRVRAGLVPMVDEEVMTFPEFK